MLHKKQAYELIESICKINNDKWDNKAGSYDDRTEAAYQIEEALEGLISEDFDVFPVLRVSGATWVRYP